jgi:hypothetical protein
MTGKITRIVQEKAFRFNLSGTRRISVYNERISDGQNGHVGLKALGINF